MTGALHFRRAVQGRPMIDLLLDLSNIVGGFLLAIGLLALIPSVGEPLARGADRLGPFGWIVGVVALVCGGYFLIVHAINGPHIFHFEIVGIITGLLLLWGRLQAGRLARTGEPPRSSSRGAGLIVAIYGIIAIIVGFEGLVTPN
ncbi:MAG: hypothetical protein WDM92_13750 [Caulobacteraceae bacterium]